MVMKTHFKIWALIPEIRKQVCYHEHRRYLGRIPCTGPLACYMCGHRKEER